MIQTNKSLCLLYGFYCSQRSVKFCKCTFCLIWWREIGTVFKSDKSKRETCYSSELRTLACVSQSAVWPRIRADRGQTGAVQCCSAAVLQGHASDSPLYRYTAKPVPADAKNTREKKVFLWTLWFGNSELGWWCYGSSTFPGTTWTQAGRCVVSSVSV